MANLTAITSWTADDALHFARRAGFGLSPEAATALGGQAPGAAIDAWVDGTGVDFTAFNAASCAPSSIVRTFGVAATPGVIPPDIYLRGTTSPLTASTSKPRGGSSRKRCRTT